MRQITPKARVFVVSDSTGHTAETLTRAALGQFGAESPEIERFGGMESIADIERIVQSAKARPTLLVYTLAQPDAAEAMRWLTELHGVAAVDVLGPVLSGLTQVLGRAPTPLARPSTGSKHEE